MSSVFMNNIQSMLAYTVPFVSKDYDVPEKTPAIVENLTSCWTKVATAEVALVILQSCIGGMWYLPLAAGAVYCGISLCLEPEGRSVLDERVSGCITGLFQKKNVYAHAMIWKKEIDSNGNQSRELSLSTNASVSFNFISNGVSQNMSANIKALVKGEATMEEGDVVTSFASYTKSIALTTLALVALQYSAFYTMGAVLVGGTAYTIAALNSSERGMDSVNGWISYVRETVELIFQREIKEA